MLINKDDNTYYLCVMDINIFSNSHCSSKEATLRHILTLLTAAIANYILWTLETYDTAIPFGTYMKSSFLVDIISCSLEAVILMEACLAACRATIRLFWKRGYSFGAILIQSVLLLIFVVLIAGVITYAYANLYPDETFLHWDVFLCDCLIAYFLTSLFFVSYLVNQYRDEATVALKMEIDKMKLKTDNHFVFNSFATLKTLIDTDSDEASDFCQSMSDTYRYIVSKGDTNVVELQDELRFISEYAHNLRIRHQNVTVSIDDALRHLRSLMPPLTLHELVDNAIKHNIHTSDKPLEIQITVEDERICIINRIQELTRKIESSGSGLNTLRARYRLLFGKEIDITTKDEHFIVRLPIIDKRPL